jgi:hypothetical protein
MLTEQEFDHSCEEVAPLTKLIKWKRGKKVRKDSRNTHFNAFTFLKEHETYSFQRII